MKHALIAASLVLVAGTAVGCGDGGSGGAPSDASEKEFCANFESIAKDITALGADAKPADIVKALKDAGTKLEDTGTPKGISDDERKGFELEVQKIGELPDDASTEDVSNLAEDLSKDEQAQVQAFDDYVSKTCQQ
ncbi:hypothetical protein FB382_003823 [Nocardioides ginsengisegetis]|uniref:Lipoprotein n=1 Tax=Nocardioides ginsengisegetis TaxID=661491 RepID=A0A7W3J3B1_9ACTN|nr:hypothetical protein [Nocardioides ginsengisegetis]MBA8805532.1 hypothetical protein [Nocardioides ginsengisegetis]